MVIDDFRNEYERILGLHPRYANGSIVFTTKSKTIAQNLVTSLEIIEVEALDPTSARAMLFVRTGAAVNAEADTSEIKDVLESFGHLPLQ